MTVPKATAVELADVLLGAMLRRNARALRIEPKAGGHVALLETAERVEQALDLPGALGDAVIARLALIARLDPCGAPALGRLKARAGVVGAELLVELAATPYGAKLEARRIAVDVEARSTSDRIGAYRVLDEVGRGGMGVVYRAIHEALARPVAVKVLYSTYASDPEVAARFVREARAACRSRHPGIVDVYDFGHLPDGRAFLVMELVEARTLEDVIEQDGPLPPARAVTIARQIAAALGAAHAAGIIHRDLKPANVFVDDEDRVKLGDFGAAKFAPGLLSGPGETQPGSVFGTPYYMSPEHARGREVDARTDVYALGCVLFEMLTGHVPYEGETSMDVLHKHISDPIPPITSPHGAVPDGLSRLVTRALAKRAADRHETIASLGVELDKLAAGAKGWRRWLPVTR